MKRIIKNIDPISGVTPEELLKQCEYLFQTFPSTNNISETDRWDIISNTVVKTYQKMKDGFLSSTNYEEFKNYLFITMSNNIKLHFNNKARYKNRWLDYIEIDETFNNMYSYQNYNFENEDFKKYVMEVTKRTIQTFKDKEKKIMIDYINGIPQTEIAKKLGVTKNAIHRIVKKLREKVQRIIYEKSN